MGVDGYYIVECYEFNRTHHELLIRDVNYKQYHNKSK